MSLAKMLVDYFLPTLRHNIIFILFGRQELSFKILIETSKVIYSFIHSVFKQLLEVGADMNTADDNNRQDNV